MIKKSTSCLNSMPIVLLISLLLVSGLCDCPITRYRPQFRTSQITTTQSQLSEPQLVSSVHIQPLETPLTNPNPSVIIGLTGYSYTRSSTNVQFQIVNVPNSDLSALSFEVRSSGAYETQRIFSFRFLAVDKDFTQFQVGTYKGHPINNPIPANFALLSPSLSLNTQVAIFLNGFKGVNLVNAWNIQLSSPRLESGILKYDLASNLGSLSSSQIESITYSYLIYNKIQLSTQNDIFFLPIQFSSAPSQRIKFPSLQFTDSTFYGLSMISFSPAFTHLINIMLDDKLSTDVGLIVESNLNNILYQLIVWQTAVKQPFVCSFCKDSPLLFEQRYCVSQCPGDTVPQQGTFLTECKKCSIEDIRVLDPVSRRCVCAVQHFDRAGVCTPCHYSCMSCVSEASTDCLTCDVAQTQKLTFRQLIKPTPNSLIGRCSCLSVGFYEQDFNIRCIACHPDCRTCTGAADTDCLQCNRQRTKNELGMCVCKTGYTSQIDGSCACLNPRYEVNGACINPLNACGMNEIQVVQNIRGNNNSNSNNANNNGKGNTKNTQAQPTTTTTTTKTCQCLPGFARVKGQCLPCGPNQQYNQKKGICQCIKDAIKHKTQGCIVCGSDKRYDRQSQTCVCKNKNQFLDNKGNCISCPQKSIFYEDQCYCINNYFMNAKGRCQKCNKKTDNPMCKRYGMESQ